MRGRVDVHWLQSFDSSAEIIVDETGQIEDITVLNVHTDQSGIVGLVRRLHGLGMTILKIQIVAYRIYYTLVTVAAVAYIWFLNQWNLLGWRY